MAVKTKKVQKHLNRPDRLARIERGYDLIAKLCARAIK